MLVSAECCYLSTSRPCHPFANSFRVLSVICVSSARLFVFLSIWPFFLADYSDVPALPSFFWRVNFTGRPVPSSSLNIGR